MRQSHDIASSQIEENMSIKTAIRDAYGTPAMFAGSKTGQEDAPFVFINVGGEERRMRSAEWEALPPWLGERPIWAGKG
jgi:hypothetical protein